MFSCSISKEKAFFLHVIEKGKKTGSNNMTSVTTIVTKGLGEKNFSLDTVMLMSRSALLSNIA